MLHDCFKSVRRLSQGCFLGAKRCYKGVAHDLEPPLSTLDVQGELIMHPVSSYCPSRRFQMVLSFSIISFYMKEAMLLVIGIKML